MAVFAGAKIESLLLNPSSSSTFPYLGPQPQQVCVLNRSRRVPIQRVRCDVSSFEAQLNDDDKASALQKLKTSAADRYTKEKSSIVVIGFSVHTAPDEMREKLAIPEAGWPRAIKELCSLNHIEEAAVLSTCNRMEIYVLALSKHRGVKEVTEWMSKTSGISVSEICQHRFLLYHNDAAKHLFEVTAGFDSLVLGENQIQAQVRQVIKVGKEAYGFERNMKQLFESAIKVGKLVRTETNIAIGAVSVGSAAVELALLKLHKSLHASARVLVIGAGVMGKLVIKHLVAKGYKKIVVVNRSEGRVAAISEELKGNVEIIYKPLEDMLTCAAEADVIFTSTASETPLFLKERVKDLPPVSPKVGNLRLFIDISVPRNVGSCVRDLKNVRVYHVDDLEEVVTANKEDRLRKATEAQAIIYEALQEYKDKRDSFETVPTIKKLWAYAERIRVAELEKCSSKMSDDISNKTRTAVEDISLSIMKKLLHGPRQHLKCDERDNRTLSETLENMHAVNRMYGLETDLSSILQEKLRAKGGQRQK